MEQTKYDVFISYSRKDYVDEQKNVIPGNEVSKIKEALSEAGISYWFDEDGIYSGQNFVEKIVMNIENASIFVFLSTANANRSPWTCKEIASADEFKKHIIPVRIDATPYNKKILFRIADLDYIEYYTNPQKGLDDLIKSIKAYLEELANAEKLRKEEENKKKEQERKREEELKRQKELEDKRRHEEQQRLVSEIRLSCTTLNNEEAKLELSRENLLLKVEQVRDENERENLKTMIYASRLSREDLELSKNLSYQKTINRQLEEELARLRTDTAEKDEKIEKMKANLDGSSEDLVSQYVPTEKELRKWNWGAFVFTWLWGLHFRMYWTISIFILYAVLGLLDFFEIIIIISPFIPVAFGIFGTRWGWNKGIWKNWETFLQVKAKWDRIALWSLPVLILLFMAIDYYFG